MGMRKGPVEAKEGPQLAKTVAATDLTEASRARKLEKKAKKARKEEKRKRKEEKAKRKEDKRQAKEAKNQDIDEKKRFEMVMSKTGSSDEPAASQAEPQTGNKRAHSGESPEGPASKVQKPLAGTAEADKRSQKLKLCMRKYQVKHDISPEDFAQALHSKRWDKLDFATFMKPYFVSTPSDELEMLVKGLVPRPEKKAKERKTKTSKKASDVTISSEPSAVNEFQVKKSTKQARIEAAKVRAAALNRGVGRERSSHDTPVERLHRTFTVSEHALAMEERWRAHALTDPVYATGRLTAEEEKIITDAVQAYCEERDITEETFCDLMWTQDGLSKSEKVQMNAEFVHLLPQRKPKNVYMYLKRRFSPVQGRTPFTSEQDAELLQLHEEFGSDWKLIGQRMCRSNQEVKDRYRTALAPPEEKRVRGPWGSEEDAQLRAAVGNAAKPDWSQIADLMSPRSAKQCELRFGRLKRAGLPSRLQESTTTPETGEKTVESYFPIIERRAYAKNYKVLLGDVKYMLEVIHYAKPASLSEAIKLPALRPFRDMFQLSDIIQRLNSVLPPDNIPFARKVEIGLAWVKSQPDLKVSLSDLVDSGLDDVPVASHSVPDLMRFSY